MSIQSIHWLTPGLFSPPEGVHDAATLRAVQLEKLLAWAKRQPALSDYERQLLALVGLPEGTATAPYALLGEGEEPGDSVWMRADPVHMRADLNTLLLFEGRHLDITADEASELVRAFNEHFASEDEPLRLLAPHAERWYLQLQREPRLTTYPVESAAGRSPNAYLPQGEEASRWQGLLTEAQMLFHQSEVNQIRQGQGRPTINALWIHGAGRLAQGQPRHHYKRVVASDPLALGLGQVAGAKVACCGDEIADGELRVFSGFRHAILAADGPAWKLAFDELEESVHRVMEWMSETRNRVVTLYPCNGHLYRMDGRKFRLFWRRARPFYRYYND